MNLIPKLLKAWISIIAIILIASLFQSMFFTHHYTSKIMTKESLFKMLQLADFRKGNFGLDSGSEGRTNSVLRDTDKSKTDDEANYDWDIVQQMRRTVLNRNCRILKLCPQHSLTLQDLSTKKGKLGNLIVDDIHEALYCYIPKIACTQWKRIFMVLTNQTDISEPEKIPQGTAHYSSGLKSLASLSFDVANVTYRLQKYKKFLIVRHPMERLFSAYQNKFTGNSSDSKAFMKNYAINMIKYVRNTSDVDPSGMGLKFHEFMAFLSTHDSNNFQEHWAPYYKLCHPCVIEYDFIGKYETLEDDSNAILQRIHAPPSIKFPSYNPSKTSKDLQRAINNISEDIKAKIRKTFGLDYLLFNYDHIN